MLLDVLTIEHELRVKISVIAERLAAAAERHISQSLHCFRDTGRDDVQGRRLEKPCLG